MQNYKKNEHEPTPEETHALQIKQWLWDSHYWEEPRPGYLHCKWCDCRWTSEFSLNDFTKLCPNNPKIKEYDIKRITT